MRLALGVDLGGTKIAAGAVTEHGEVLSRASVPTPAGAGPQAVLDAAAACALEAASEAARPSAGAAPERTWAGVGVGSAGVIDPEAGVVVSATSALPGWGGTSLAAGLRERLGAHAELRDARVECVNDVHAHALGEAWTGSAAGAASVLLVAFGTGVGGSLLLDGKPLSGARHVAGHVGHLPSVEAAGLPCTCGGEGHLEAIASGPAILEHFRRSGGDTTVPDTKTLFELAAGGQGEGQADAQQIRLAEQIDLAQSSIATGARAAGAALAGLANAFDPDALLLSGGLASAGPRWWEPCEEAFRDGLIGALAGLRLVPAALGPDAPIVGAASLIHRPLHRSTP